MTARTATRVAPYRQVVLTSRGLLLAALAGVIALPGCSGPAQRPGSAAGASRPPAPAAVAPGTDPLTGLAAARRHPVVVLKVDNSPQARRYQRGLGRAAVVYAELIEGGETRFAAVYDDASSGEVGPIRSARETDVDLLGQFGPVALAFSGANSGTRGTIARAAKAGRLYDASYYRFPGDYRLAEQRVDARNFFTSPAKLAASTPRASPPRDIGLRFGPLPAGAGRATSRLSARFSSYSTFTLVWQAARGTWQVREGGRTVSEATNVVVQRVPLRKTRYRDVLGNPTPFTVTVGKGAAVVLRDGRRIDARWQRTSATGGTRYVDSAGRDVPLKPGRTWVLLAPSGMPVTAS